MISTKKGKIKQPVAILPNGEYYYQTVESDMDPRPYKRLQLQQVDFSITQKAKKLLEKSIKT
jgi:hypothetical protein